MSKRGQKPAGQDDNNDNTTYILITGANAGLGLATCTRIIDEFIAQRPTKERLHLIATTRSQTKSKETIDKLQRHINRNSTLKANSDRITFSHHEVDLTNLRTVLELANTLNDTYPYLNVLICNAGLMGTEGIDWLRTIWALITDPMQSITWPKHVKHSLRALAKPQLSIKQDTGKSSTQEPPLGQIFTSNVFGHYILAAHLMPLLTRTPQQAGDGRVIWTSSIETTSTAFDLNDIQCLERREAYSSSKRLTDLLVLTYDHPQSRQAVSQFTSTAEPGRRPKMYIAHPGVTLTQIVPLPLIMIWLQYIGYIFVRLIGSPWHFVSAYKGAVSTVWVALAPSSTIDGLEERGGKGKWGSATNPFGQERVRRTEVDGWGYGGVVGEEKQYGNSGRRRGATNLMIEDRHYFDELGAKVWQKMESLRMEWEERLQQ